MVCGGGFGVAAVLLCFYSLTFTLNRSLKTRAHILRLLSSPRSLRLPCSRSAASSLRQRGCLCENEQNCLFSHSFFFPFSFLFLSFSLISLTKGCYSDVWLVLAGSALSASCKYLFLRRLGYLHEICVRVCRNLILFIFGNTSFLRICGGRARHVLAVCWVLLAGSVFVERNRVKNVKVKFVKIK